MSALSRLPFYLICRPLFLDSNLPLSLSQYSVQTSCTSPVSENLGLRQPLSLSHTHMHAHKHTLSQTQTRIYTHMPPHKLSHCFTHAHTGTHTHTTPAPSYQGFPWVATTGLHLVMSPPLCRDRNPNGGQFRPKLCE
jgi:hypothetical protein